MRTARGRRAVVAVGLVVAGMVAIAAGCGAARESPWHDAGKESPELSAVRLGDPWAEGSVADFLGPEERDAVSRAGLSWADEEARASLKPDAPAEPPGKLARTADHAGKLGVTLMGVGITLGALVAPFFLL